MISLLAGLAMAQTAYQRVNLPNGASIVYAQFAKQPTATIELFASARYAPDSPQTHGYRHLLEHLIARGADGDADGPLEAVGGLLKARTFRDATQIEITVSSEHVQEGFAALADVVAKRKFTQAEIDRECQTIAEEAALTEAQAVLVDAGWIASFGEDGLDSVGDLAALQKATPEDMEAVRDAIFRGPCVSVVIAGDVPSKTIQSAVSLIGPLPSERLTPVIRRAGKPGRSEAATVGEARCAAVPAFDRPTTASSLAAAFALAAQLDDCFVSYTPTMQRGLITLGRVGQTSGISLYVDSLKRDSVEPLYRLGKRLALRWYQMQTSTPQNWASLRAALICEDPSGDPEQFVSQLNAMSLEDFVEAVHKYQSSNAVTVVGVGP